MARCALTTINTSVADSSSANLGNLIFVGDVVGFNLRLDTGVGDALSLSDALNLSPSAVSRILNE